MDELKFKSANHLRRLLPSKTGRASLKQIDGWTVVPRPVSVEMLANGSSLDSCGDAAGQLMEMLVEADVTAAGWAADSMPQSDEETDAVQQRRPPTPPVVRTKPQRTPPHVAQERQAGPRSASSKRACSNIFEMLDNEVRGSPGEHVLLLRRYYHRTVEDRDGLTFRRWEAKKGEILAINSSELRAVSGHQANDFVLAPINAPTMREKYGRAKKGARTDEVVHGPKQRWALDPEIDADTRTVCEGT